MRIKILIYILTFGGSIAALFVSLQIAINILLYGYIRYSESNLIGLWIEFIWILFSFISLPFLTIDSLKKELKKNANLEI